MPRAGGDDKCPIKSFGVVECPWPYGDIDGDGITDNYARGLNLVDMDAGVLGASYTREVKAHRSEKGFLVVQAKAYGYEGGGYRLKIYAEAATGRPPARPVKVSPGVVMSDCPPLMRWWRAGYTRCDSALAYP